MTPLPSYEILQSIYTFTLIVLIAQQTATRKYEHDLSELSKEETKSPIRIGRKCRDIVHNNHAMVTQHG